MLRIRSIPWFSSVTGKLIFSVVVVLTFAGSAFFYIAHRTGFAMLEKQSRARASGMAKFGQTLTESLMLDGRADRLRTALSNIVKGGQARGLVIYRADGTVAMSAGDEDPSMPEMAMAFRNLQQSPSGAYTLQRERDSLYAYVVAPLVNRPACQECHRDSNPIRGYFGVKISLDNMRSIALEHRTTNILMSFGLFAVLGASVITVVVALVVRPMRKLHSHVQLLEAMVSSLERGEHPVFPSLEPSTRRDEIAAFGNAFNRLVEKLNVAHNRLRQVHTAELTRADQLRSMGEMAAGIAHEIKNPLAGLQGALRVFSSELPAADQRREIVDEMTVQTDRIHKAVTDLLSYARPTPPRFIATSVSDIVKRTLILLGPELHRQRISVHTVGLEEALLLMGDPKLLQQALWNILQNAADVAGVGGRVGLRAVVKADRLILEIEDNGQGVAPEDRAQLFKPFYTTKHKGTGLGLVISRTIVEQHRGTITFASVTGVGTTVTMDLPISLTEDASDAS